MTQNKINIKQREKAGAITFAKYDYQYHWALYKALSLTQVKRDYIILIEMHEDVVVGDSLDGESVKYDFYQVKTTRGKYNVKKLTDRKTKEDGHKADSVLGKLLSYDRRFANPKNIIKSYNLVASNGFDFKLNEEGEYEEFHLDSIIDDEVTKLSEAIKKELGLNELPVNLHFIHPSYLKEDAFQVTVLAMITKVMDEVFESSYGAKKVYLTLIDEFHRKGQQTLDFNRWEDLKEKGGITSDTVEKVIRQFADQWSKSDFQQRLEDYMPDMNLHFLEKGNFRNEITDWLVERSEIDSVFYLISRQVSNYIKFLFSDGIGDSFSDICEAVWNELDSSSRNIFEVNTSLKFKAMVICESIYIQQRYGQTRL